jgi:hypothetical protein
LHVEIRRGWRGHLECRLRPLLGAFHGVDLPG